ncbi:unnamed protein product [Jaminaea pallidilutea]
MAGHGHQIKNADGTVNLEGLQGHVNNLKAKYAQNARNYEANTGQPFNASARGGDGDDDEVKRDPTAGSGAVGQSRGDADHDGPEGFADSAQPQGSSGQTRQGPGGESIGTESHDSRE